MNDDPTDLNQSDEEILTPIASDEEILTPTASDEALEAAAGTRGRALTAAWTLDCGTCSPASC